MGWSTELALRPCPYCGNLDLRVNSDLDPKFIACTKCWAFGPTAATVREAAERWNKRPGPLPESNNSSR